MKDLDAAVCHRDSAARAQTVVRETLVEIIINLPLKHDVGERLVAHTRSKSRHIRVRLRKAEIITVCPNLTVILRRGQRYQPTCEKQQKCDTLHTWSPCMAILGIAESKGWLLLG